MKAIEFGKEHKDTVVLLHGGGLSWWNYKEAASLLADRFHVVLPILDGHAGSDAPFTSIEDNARRIIAYIDETHNGRVLLIGGLSLGGQVLVEMLSQRSDICEFALIESALVLPMPLTAALTRPAYAMCYPLIKKRWFSKLQFWALHIKPELFEAYFSDTAGISKADMIAFIQANAKYRMKAALAGCKAKTFITAGSKELPKIKRSVRLLTEHLPRSECEIIKHYSHGDLSINHADRYVKTLLRLIGA